ncbi:MAG: prepilin-type N-terminal cleavage/methylation domain-containing protein [Candidatus Staskawiczbacteria bacterium]|nr:prepilin-type N-terminal cleavage/methylation domain-containing protein [Candidatus Staskawiczbacteria bacterium]
MDAVNKKNKGFTIVEMAVVMAIFLFVIGAAVSIFLSVVSHQKRILAQEQLLNQVSYALEYMSKGLRMARPELNYNCMVYEDKDGIKSDTVNGGFIYLLTRLDGGAYRGVKFLNQSDVINGNPLCQEFFLDNGVVKEIRNGSEPVAITSPSFVVNSMRISINGKDGTSASCVGQEYACGASDADFVQPRITIVFNISVPGDSEPERTFQTTVSQRNLNVK